MLKLKLVLGFTASLYVDSVNDGSPFCEFW